MIKKGSKVRYTGPDLVAYETGKIYTVMRHKKGTDMYSVMSELDEAYYLPIDYLEEVE